MPEAPTKIDLSFLPRRIRLSEETKAAPTNRLAGLSFEKDWQGQLPSTMIAIFGSPVDGRVIITGQNVDAKCVFSDYFYLSNDERGHGRKYGMIYAGYVNIDDYAELAFACSWEDLREEGFFESFKGRQAYGEDPWRVSIENALKVNLL